MCEVACKQNHADNSCSVNPAKVHALRTQLPLVVSRLIIYESHLGIRLAVLCTVLCRHSWENIAFTSG